MVQIGPTTAVAAVGRAVGRTQAAFGVGRAAGDLSAVRIAALRRKADIRSFRQTDPRAAVDDADEPSGAVGIVGAPCLSGLAETGALSAAAVGRIAAARLAAAVRSAGTRSAQRGRTAAMIRGIGLADGGPAHASGSTRERCGIVAAADVALRAVAVSAAAHVVLARTAGTRSAAAQPICRTQVRLAHVATPCLAGAGSSAHLAGESDIAVGIGFTQTL